MERLDDLVKQQQLLLDIDDSAAAAAAATGRTPCEPPSLGSGEDASDAAAAAAAVAAEEGAAGPTTASTARSSLLTAQHLVQLNKLRHGMARHCTASWLCVVARDAAGQRLYITRGHPSHPPGCPPTCPSPHTRTQTGDTFTRTCASSFMHLPMMSASLTASRRASSPWKRDWRTGASLCSTWSSFSRMLPVTTLGLLLAASLCFHCCRCGCALLGLLSL